jgi:hypothetical protein
LDIEMLVGAVARERTDFAELFGAAGAIQVV